MLLTGFVTQTLACIEFRVPLDRFNPFVEFFARNRAWGILILAFIACFWMSDRVWGVMAQPFYEKLGFDKIEIAVLSKTIGLWVTVVGALLGSIIVARWGIMGPLLISAVLIASTNLLFAVLENDPPLPPRLRARNDDGPSFA